MRWVREIGPVLVLEDMFCNVGEYTLSQTWIVRASLLD